MGASTAAATFGMILIVNDASFSWLRSSTKITLKGCSVGLSFTAFKCDNNPDKSQVQSTKSALSSNFGVGGLPSPNACAEVALCGSIKSNLLKPASTNTGEVVSTNTFENLVFVPTL